MELLQASVEGASQTNLGRIEAAQVRPVNLVSPPIESNRLSVTADQVTAKQTPVAVNVAGQAIAVQIAGRQDADEGTADIVDLFTQLITTCASDMQAEDVFAMDALAQRGIQSHGSLPPATHNDFDHDTLLEPSIAEPIIGALASRPAEGLSRAVSPASLLHNTQYYLHHGKEQATSLSGY